MGDKKRQRSIDWARQKLLEDLMKKTNELSSKKEKIEKEDKNVD